MNVNLGSITLDEAQLRLIHRAMSPYARSGRATRVEVKAWAMATLASEIDVLAEAFAPGPAVTPAAPSGEVPDGI